MGTDSNSGNLLQAKRFELLFRVTPLALCIAAMAIMLKNKQSNQYGALHYSDVGGFKYLVYANGICAIYSILSLLGSVLSTGIDYSWTRAWIMFILDQALTYLILTAGVCGVEIMDLAYQGNEQVSWSRVCVSYGKFCNDARASVLITMAVLVCFMVLSLLSAHRLFSKYEAPIVNNGHHTDFSQN
jgi:uncharacterized protein (TIGR01569 family)